VLVDLCPITGRRAGVLYLPGKGGTMFARRHASGLAYRSQRASPEDRAIERSLKARTKLGVADQNMLDMPYCAASLMLAQLLRKHGLGAVVFAAHGWLTRCDRSARRERRVVCLS
jgi:hypothetical protein